MPANPHTTVNVTSIGPRIRGLQRVVNRLRGQCDHMNVYLKGYSRALPVWLKRDNIQVWFASDHGGDNRAIDKHYPAPEDGWVLTVDDDINYPKDYVQTMVWHAEKLGRGVITSCHGSLLLQGPYTYWGNGMRQLLHFWARVPEYTPVHIGGTGVMIHHARDPFPSWRWMVDSGCISDDIAVACWAQQNKVPIVVVPHPAQWLSPNLNCPQEISISRQIRADQGSVVPMLNSCHPWKTMEVPNVSNV